jgi:hypothetical protein
MKANYKKAMTMIAATAMCAVSMTNVISADAAKRVYKPLSDVKSTASSDSSDENEDAFRKNARSYEYKPDIDLKDTIVDIGLEKAVDRDNVNTDMVDLDRGKGIDDVNIGNCKGLDDIRNGRGLGGYNVGVGKGLDGYDVGGKSLGNMDLSNAGFGSGRGMGNILDGLDNGLNRGGSALNGKGPGALCNTNGSSGAKFSCTDHESGKDCSNGTATVHEYKTSGGTSYEVVGKNGSSVKISEGELVTVTGNSNDKKAFVNGDGKTITYESGDTVCTTDLNGKNGYCSMNGGETTVTWNDKEITVTTSEGDSITITSETEESSETGTSSSDSTATTGSDGSSANNTASEGYVNPDSDKNYGGVPSGEVESSDSTCTTPTQDDNDDDKNKGIEDVIVLAGGGCADPGQDDIKEHRGISEKPVLVGGGCADPSIDKVKGDDMTPRRPIITGLC